MLAVFNVFYNSVKSVSEVREWAFLTDHEKRHKLFGDTYDFYTFINKNSQENANILFMPKDEMSFYLARYYLYPRLITRVTNEEQVAKFSQTGTYTHVATFVPLQVDTIIPKSSKDSEGFLYRLP